MHQLYVLYDEIRWISRHLISNYFDAELKAALAEHEPLPEDFIESVKNYFVQIDTDGSCSAELLKWSENESPFLLNRDLAAIALLRQGQVTEARKDKVTGLMLYSEKGSKISLEAAFSFCHPKIWDEPLSRWWDWQTYIDVIDRGFEHPVYTPWAAHAYLWAFVRQGGVLGPEDPSYEPLIENLGPYLATPSKTSELTELMSFLKAKKQTPNSEPCKALMIVPQPNL